MNKSEEIKKIVLKSSDGEYFPILSNHEFYKGVFTVFNEDEAIPFTFVELCIIFHRMEISDEYVASLIFKIVPLGIDEINEILLSKINRILELETKIEDRILDYIYDMGENVSIQDIKNSIEYDYTFNKKIAIKSIKNTDNIFKWKNFDSSIFSVINLPYNYYEMINSVYGVYSSDESTQKIIRHILNNINFINFDYEKNENPIYFLLKYGCYDLIELAFDKGLKVKSKHSKDKVHRSIIGDILYYSNYQTTKLVIEKGYDLESENKYRTRLIHLACSKNDLDMFKYLEEKGISLEYQNEDDERLIDFTCKSRGNDVCKYLIEKGDIDLEYKNKRGERLMHIACKYMNMGMIKYLIEKGVELNCVDCYGNIPYDMCLFYRKISPRELSELLGIPSFGKYVNKIKANIIKVPF